MNHSHIQGWGADLDPKNRPAVPKERMPNRLPNVHWTQPEQQEQKVVVFHSTERPGITPVFGTTLPPKGLSGKLRSWAFRYSENDLRHWFILIAADRINVVEGILQDLGSGHVPNIFGEMGIKAEMKYNKKGFARKLLLAAAVAGVAGFLIARKLRKD